VFSADSTTLEAEAMQPGALMWVAIALGVFWALASFIPAARRRRPATP
jgi:hypothetical protein